MKVKKSNSLIQFPQGDPMLLSKYMKEKNLSVSDINSMSREQLVPCATYCKMTSTGKSQVASYSGHLNHTHISY